MVEERSVVLLIGADSSEALREFDRVKAAARVASGEIGGIGAAGAGAAPGVGLLADSGIRLDKSLRQSGAAVRALTVPLLSELGPAMGTTASQVAGVLGAAASLGGGMGALAVAAGGLTGILVGKLVGGLSETERGIQRTGKEARDAAASIDALVDSTLQVARSFDDLRSKTTSDPAIQRFREQRAQLGLDASRRQLAAGREAEDFGEGFAAAFGGAGFQEAKRVLDLQRGLDEARARSRTDAATRDAELDAAALSRQRQRLVASLAAAKQELDAEQALAETGIKLLGELGGATRDFYAEKVDLARRSVAEVAALAEQEARATARGFDPQIAEKRRQLTELRQQPGFAESTRAQTQAVDLAADAKRMEDQKVEAARRGADEILKLNEDLARELRRLELERTRGAIAQWELQTQAHLSELAKRKGAIDEARDILKALASPETLPKPSGPLADTLKRAVAPAADPGLRSHLLQMGLEGARGGETDPSAFRVIRKSEDLLSGRADDRAIASALGLGAVGPPPQLPTEPRPERPIFRGIGPGGELSFQNEGPRPGFSQLTMPDTVKFGDAAAAATTDFGGAGKSAADSFAAALSASRGGEIGAEFMGGLAEKVKDAAAGIAEDLSRQIGQAILERAEQSGF